MTNTPTEHEAVPNGPTVYFVRTGGAIKIGFSAKVGRRLSGLQTGHHRKLSLIGYLPSTGNEELDLHEKFKHLHIRGEWFDAGPDLLAFIDANCQKPKSEDSGPSEITVLRAELSDWMADHADDENVKEYGPDVLSNLRQLEKRPNDPKLRDWTMRFIRRMRGETTGVSFWPQHKNGFIDATA